MNRSCLAARFAFSLLVLQLASPTVSAVADSILEAQEANQVAHIESEGDSACQLAHDDLCQICRALSIAGGPERAVRITSDLPAAIPQSLNSDADHCLSDYCASYPSRAPPVA